jgi:hypothetical protein
MTLYRSIAIAILSFGLWGCGGEITTEGPLTQSSRFRMGLNGECVTNEGVACMYETANQTPSDTPPDTAQVPPEELTPEEGGCWVTGIGTFGKADTRDSFGGNGMTMKDGSVRGEWNHVDHLDESGTTVNGQNHFHGVVNYLVCSRYPTLNGPDVPKAIPNFAIWGGTGSYNNVDGYFFEVHAFDHGEPGAHHDRYTIDVYDSGYNLVLHADGTGTYDTPPNTKGCEEDVTLTEGLEWVGDMGCLSGGNFQIHPPNNGHPY